MTTGRLPFDGQSYFQALDAILHSAPTPIAELRPDAPPALVAIVMRALEKSPKARFALAEEMASALHQV
jgi:serine/threonine-protein kinase